MLDGDPEVETTPELKEEIVLSQRTETQPEESLEVQTEPEKVEPEISPEQRFRNSQSAQARIALKALKLRKVEEIDHKKLVEEAAKDAGFDPEKEENKSQIKFQASLASRTSEAIKRQNFTAANANIVDTLTDLGVDPNSTKGHIIGNALLKKYKTGNPDIYQDVDLVQREIEVIAEEFTGKRNPIKETIMRKASSNLPQKVNPKGGSAPSEDKKFAEEANSMGLSKEKYKILQEKAKKIPSWAKRRS